MKSLFCVAFYFLMSITTLVAQDANKETWGCPRKDYKCQLDVRIKALQADPKNPENYYNLGVVYQRAGNHAQAVEAFGMYISIPGIKRDLLADGHNMRGISERALRRPDLAYADYSKAIELNPKNPTFLVNRGNASLDMQKPDQGLADYARAITVDPTFALAYANRGHFFFSTGKLDDAIKDLTKAIELDATNPEPFYSRALAYREKKEYAKAIPDLDKYIALEPDNNRYLADGYLNRGISYALTGNTDRALADMSKAIDLAPDYVDAYGARALLYRQIKKNDLADADERKAKELTTLPKPPAGGTRTSIDYLEEGSKYYIAGEYKSAIGPYQKALDLEKQQSKLPKTLWILLIDNLGMAYGITGDIKSSFSVFEYGISKEPTYPLFYYNMACGYGELGDEENAIKYLRLAFRYKANMLEGEHFPNPMTDSSFKKFLDTDRFKTAITEMK